MGRELTKVYARSYRGWGGSTEDGSILLEWEATDCKGEVEVTRQKGKTWWCFHGVNKRKYRGKQKPTKAFMKKVFAMWLDGLKKGPV